MRKKSRRNAHLRTLTNPDVTPLVDLTFLLLIVFLITAPVLEYSLDITPPELNAEKIDPKVNKIINLDKHGLIFLDNDPITKENLSRSISSLHSRNKELQIFIRADEVRPYGEVMDLMRLVQDIGINDVSLVTMAED